MKVIGWQDSDVMVTLTRDEVEKMFGAYHHRELPNGKRFNNLKVGDTLDSRDMYKSTKELKEVLGSGKDFIEKFTKAHEGFTQLVKTLSGSVYAILEYKEKNEQ